MPPSEAGSLPTTPAGASAGWCRRRSRSRCVETSRDRIAGRRRDDRHRRRRRRRARRAGGAGLRGVEAVIDKDYVAAELAMLAGGRSSRVRDRCSAADARLRRPTASAPWTRSTWRPAERYQRDGQFPAGSMGPKVQAATQFLRSGGELAVISTAEFAAGTLEPTDDATATAPAAQGAAPGSWPPAGQHGSRHDCRPADLP